MSAAWLLTAMGTFEQRFAHYSHEMDGGLIYLLALLSNINFDFPTGMKQIQKDISEAQQSSIMAAVCCSTFFLFGQIQTLPQASPSSQDVDYAKEMNNMLQKVKDLEWKQRILEEKVLIYGLVV